MLTLRAERVAARRFPRNNRAQEFRQRDHSPRRGGDAAMTARTAVIASTLAWFLHPFRTPWPAQPTVSVLDMFKLRNPSPCKAYRRGMAASPLLPIRVR